MQLIVAGREWVAIVEVGQLVLDVRERIADPSGEPAAFFLGEDFYAASLASPRIPRRSTNYATFSFSGSASTRVGSTTWPRRLVENLKKSADS